ncbi:hypothetical protein GF420_05780, partial [candidate division GN15 bacterium]|nr:hypothetical protein [candidate division GN15 bacterium]
MKIIALSLLALLAFCLHASTTRADSWASPYERAHRSASGRYCLVTVPGGDTLVAGNLPNELQFEHPFPWPTADSAVATLYRQGADSVFRPIWTSVLANRVDPVAVLVHDSGRWVVTLDDWHFVGYDENVVVIYDSLGNVVRNLALADFVPSYKVENFARTSSSIWWRCGGRFQYGLDQVEFRLVSNGRMPVWNDLTICEDYVRLDLATGEVVSFESKYDQALLTWPSPCPDQYLCPTVRYFYYQMDHPDSTVIAGVDSLQLSGTSTDSLRRVYECFTFDWPWHFGAALRYIGREVELAVAGLSPDEFTILVHVSPNTSDRFIRDSLPLIVRLPD